MILFKQFLLLTLCGPHATSSSGVEFQPPEPDLEKSLRAAIKIGNATQEPGNLISWSSCERYGQHALGRYVLYNDLWNEPVGTGSQCVGLRGADASSWFTKWSWQQRSATPQVMSFANVELDFGTGAAIGRFGSLKSRWQASYTGVGMSANVAFDIFIRPPGAGAQIEIMGWVKKYGAVSPISSTNDPIAEVQLPSGLWALYKGHNEFSRMDVYSFVISTASIGGPINYDGDLLEFLHHLIQRKVIDDQWQIVKVGAGTEATIGRDCFFLTSHYSLVPVVK